MAASSRSYLVLRLLKWPLHSHRILSLVISATSNQARVSREGVAGYNRALHGFAVALAACALLLLVAGALVTSNDAGLAVPDWPTTFGSFHMPRMVGGVKWEHGH